MQKDKKYVYAADIMRVVAIMAVVLVHTTTRTLQQTGYELYKTVWPLFLNQSMRFAVPLFFMISGFVLELNYNVSLNYWSYLKKRFSRIFLPYIFWSLFYFFFVYKSSLNNLLPDLLTGNASYQLYFIPVLLLFYLIFPYLHSIYNFISNKWFLILSFVLEIVLLYQEYYVKNFTLPYIFDVALFNFYVFIFGMVASNNQKMILDLLNKFRYLIVILTVFFAVFITWQGRNLYYKTFNIDAFYSNWRPLVFIYTFCIGGLLFLVFKKNKESRFVKLLSKLSFFVFFIHVYVLEITWKIVGTSLSFWYDPFFFLIVAGVSFGIGYLIHKIPYFSKITG